jgi:stress-induced morphogen
MEDVVVLLVVRNVNGEEAWRINVGSRAFRGQQVSQHRFTY